jgi:subtilisin family serine protease
MEGGTNMEDVETRESGCGPVLAVVALITWLGLVPVGVTILVNVMLEGNLAAAVALTVAAVLLLPLFVSAALIARGRSGGQEVAAVAAGLAAIAGYLVLDGAIRLAVAGQPLLVAGLRLALLVPYVLLTAWIAPRLAGVPRRSLARWLGIRRVGLPTLLLGLGLSALLTLPWPLTGALGDRIVSLRLLLQTLAWIVPQVLLFWGLISSLLNTTFRHSWLAAAAIVILYAFTLLGGVMPTGDWGVLLRVLFLVPLAFLLTEMRARDDSVYPLLVLASFYVVVPLLFVDPRDATAQGIPEPIHILSYAASALIATVLALTLTAGRRLLLALRDRVQLASWTWVASAALVALVLWLVWGAVYVLAGEPGFYDDGFLIILEEQADLEAAYDIADREARLQYVYDTLVATADRSQVDLRAELDELGVPYRPYYIINMIRVDGHSWLMGRFEDRPGVERVIPNPNVRPYPRRIGIPSVEEEVSPGLLSSLAAVHADEAWELGVTGEGVVVGGQDTGYDWNHPALRPHYRGWDGAQADHDYNWHDAWDLTLVPFDDDSHGTHTMGTVLGDNGAGLRVGMAPGATWIGCRNMRRGFGNPGSYAECMEFFLAPYPLGGDSFTEGDVRLAAHVTNNSWGCPEIEGCFPTTLQPAVEATRAAGIMMVVSAGNEGPACGTAATPPANYDAAFSVGATGDGGTIVSFSSRGPVEAGVKPDVSAPGMSVLSAIPGGGYARFSGTSMAGPHVAGLVALLWAADPALIGDIDATEALICSTAEPQPVQDACVPGEVPENVLAAQFTNPICACGGVVGVPNNVYGCGFINAGAAVEAALGD